MNTKIYILLAVVLLFVACENQETDFEDFGTTACYFPYQTPARTLILGKYELGLNDNDNNHVFEIGVTMGGVYKNTEDRKVHFRLASELLDSVNNVVALPSAYYTIETESPVTIPAGSFKGRIRVQLTDQFFDDTLSFAPLDSVNYVIPLLITQVENLDTILSGKPLVDNPTRVAAEDWSVLPQDYALFGIKFINKYHAMYLRSGVDVMTNSLDSIYTTAYHKQYVEENELVMLTTSGRNSIKLSNIVRRGSAAPTPPTSYDPTVNFELLFDGIENCSIQSVEGDGHIITSGNGKFVDNGGIWGGKEHDAIFLEYNYTDTTMNETHHVYDTLVVRDRNVVFEEFNLY